MAPTDAHLQAVAIIPMFTGTLSIIGSVTIIWIIMRSHLKLKIIYHRLMFGLGFSDIFQSLSLALSSLPVPKGTPYIKYAYGNQGTCNFQGYIHVFGAVALPLYFCSLAGYYLLSIKFGKSDGVIQMYYEPFAHAIPLLYGLIGATYVAIHSGFFTSGNICWIAPYPIGCDKTDAIACERGSDFAVSRWAILGWTTLASFVFISTSMILVILTISRNRPVDTSLVLSDENNSEDGKESSDATKQREEVEAKKIRREGMIQALLYIASFFISYIFAFIYHGMDKASDKRPPIGVFIGAKVTVPSQGFMNFFIFIRPRMISIKRQNPTLSWYQAFVKAIVSRDDSNYAPQSVPETGNVV